MDKKFSSSILDEPDDPPLFGRFLEKFEETAEKVYQSFQNDNDDEGG